MQHNIMNFITRHVNASVWNVSLDRFDSRTLFRCRIIEAFSFVSKKAWLSSDKSLTPSGWEPHVADSLQCVSMTAVKLRLLIFTSENLRLPRYYDEPKNSYILHIYDSETTSTRRQGWEKGWGGGCSCCHNASLLRILGCYNYTFTQFHGIASSEKISTPAVLFKR